MERPGTSGNPLRVAVIGSGPAGFYTIQHLFQAKDLAVEIDLFDRLPTPFGLVRHGVAPDHPKIKSVIAVYHKLACRPGFRFFGNVELGRDVTRAELERCYHQIVVTTGAQSDRRMGIPGEDLLGSHPATEFVAWYNGHPDYSHLTFDLSGERAVVVGVGNVAIDVARILCRTPAELAATDIADYALAALAASRIREVYLLGRRGPVQAAFTTPEVKELGELIDAEAVTLPAEVELDPASRVALESADRATIRKVEILQAFARQTGPARSRRLVIRFLVSPVAILGDAEGRVRALTVVRNELYAGDDGQIRARPTEQIEQIDTGLVFRSVGYRGVAVPGLPFDESSCIVPNAAGRVLDPGSGQPLPGLYVSGWIKRGPTGVIGTNKPDAAETVRAMLEDLEGGRTLVPASPAPAAVESLLGEKGLVFCSYADWERLDAIEIARASGQGRPRVKLTRHEDFLAALKRSS